jgi:hypothetical protein
VFTVVLTDDLSLGNFGKAYRNKGPVALCFFVFHFAFFRAGVPGPVFIARQG